MTVTLNPSDKSSDIALSGGNLTATYTDDSNNGACRATQSFSSGKLYYEWQSGGTNSSNCNAGWASASAALNSMGSTTDSVNANQQFSQVKFNNGSLGAVSASAASGDWLGFAIDLGNKLVWVINWTQGHGWNNSGNTTLSGVTGYSISGLTNLPWFPEVDFYGGEGNAVTLVNFGATAFQGTLPPGYSSVSSAAGGGGKVPFPLLRGIRVI
jgi:hypothetical protein